MLGVELYNLIIAQQLIHMYVLATSSKHNLIDQNKVMLEHISYFQSSTKDFNESSFIIRFEVAEFYTKFVILFYQVVMGGWESSIQFHNSIKNKEK